MSYRKLYYLGALVFLLCAFFSEGWNAWDEHFQIVEFAGLRLGLTDASALPWEYHHQMRPGLQPFIFFLIYSGFKILGITDPFVVAFAARLFNAAISFISMILLIRVYEKSFSRPELAKAFVLLSLFLWFSVYNGVRFSSDTTSGRIFIIGFAWFMLKRDENFMKYLITGLFLGLAFILRYQVAFMVLGFAAWLLFMHKAVFRHLLAFSAAILLMFGVGVLTDRWLYGEWTLTTWNYLNQNIILDKVSGFGIMPWHYYFTEPFMNGVPPFSLVYILAVLIYFIFKPKDIVTWTLFPFLLVHFLIGHKEMRFLFPMTGFMAWLIMASADLLIRKAWAGSPSSPPKKFSKGITIPAKIFWYANLLMLVIVTFRPADSMIGLYRKIYYTYSGPAILYTVQDNPYYRVKDIAFYRRKSLEIRKTDTLITLPQDSRPVLLATLHPGDLKMFPGKSELVYASLPDWLRKMNINNWVDRTEFWHLYEIRISPPHSPPPMGERAGGRGK